MSRTSKLVATVVAVACTAAVMAVQEPEPAHAATGVCNVSAQNPHLSTHSIGKINAIGEVRCTYDPIGTVLLEVRLSKKAGNFYNLQQTDLNVLVSQPTYVRHSRSMWCQPGTYRTEARARAAGPNGEPAAWSLWAIGTSVTISC